MVEPRGESHLLHHPGKLITQLVAKWSLFEQVLTLAAVHTSEAFPLIRSITEMPPMAPLP